jgi:hypothetical protein
MGAVLSITNKAMNKQQVKKLSNYELEERLACLNELIGTMNEYRHVIDSGDRIYKEVENERSIIIDELDRRELED